MRWCRWVQKSSPGYWSIASARSEWCHWWLYRHQRISWQIAGVVLILFMVPAITYLLRNHSQRRQKYLDELLQINNTTERVYRRRQWTRSEVIRDKLFYLFAPGLMSQPLMFTGFIFHQVHLVESKNWSLSGWASLFAMYALVSVGTDKQYNRKSLPKATMDSI